MTEDWICVKCGGGALAHSKATSDCVWEPATRTPSPLPADEDREELLNALNANFFYADDDTSVAELRDAVLAWMERVDAAMTAYRGNVLAAMFSPRSANPRVEDSESTKRGRRNASD